MIKLRRRETLELGAAILAIGPSVLFSRTADAAGKRGRVAALQNGRFTVAVEGAFDTVPGVVSVDLGTATFEGGKPQFGQVKITLQAGTDASQLTAEKKSHSSGGVKVSVSLLAGEKGTPVVSYHLGEAVPLSMVTNKTGRQVLSYQVGSVTVERAPGEWREAVARPPGEWRAEKITRAPGEWRAPGVVALQSKFRVELEGVALASIQALTKEPGRVAMTAFVSADDPPGSSVLFGRAAKAPGDPTRGVALRARSQSKGQKDLNFANAVLTSIELPRLEIGNTDPVVETFHFKLA